MTDRDIDVVLESMFEAARLATSYIDGLDESAFLQDVRTQQAVAMNLIIIGEGVLRLGRHHADFLERHPELPWGDMIGIRNRIAHGYFDINMHVVWETVLTAVPELLYRLKSIREAGAQNGPEPKEPNGV
ncbi:MAG: DUF86 domain-containing protein [Methylocystis sp.]|nr:DUF86 domain-containing protein [Methylocystis sp.]MBI3275547.1 DUF86 domain-containing protein [Methylocystis sp.]